MFWFREFVGHLVSYFTLNMTRLIGGFGGLTPRQPQPRNVSLKNYNAQTQTRPGLTNRMPAAHLKPYQPHAA